MSKAAVSASPPPSSSYVMMFSRTSSSSSGDRESRFWRRSDNDRALTAAEAGRRGSRRYWGEGEKLEEKRMMSKGEGGRSHRGNKGKEEEGAQGESLRQTKRWGTRRQNNRWGSLRLESCCIISAGCMPPLCNWLWTPARQMDASLSHDFFILIPYSQSRGPCLTPGCRRRIKPWRLFNSCPTRLPVIKSTRKDGFGLPQSCTLWQEFLWNSICLSCIKWRNTELACSWQREYLYKIIRSSWVENSLKRDVDGKIYLRTIKKKKKSQKKKQKKSELAATFKTMVLWFNTEDNKRSSSLVAN